MALKAYGNLAQVVAFSQYLRYFWFTHCHGDVSKFTVAVKTSV